MSSQLIRDQHIIRYHQSPLAVIDDAQDIELVSQPPDMRYVALLFAFVGEERDSASGRQV